MGGVKNNLLTLLLPFIGILFVLELSKLIDKYAKKTGRCLNVLMLLSASSYMIYLFHTTFEGFAKALCHKLIVDTGTGYIFVVESAFIILVGVAVPVLLYNCILKRYTITRKLFGL